MIVKKLLFKGRWYLFWDSIKYFKYFKHFGSIWYFVSNILLIIGGLAGVFENIVGISSGKQNSLFTVIIAVIIGVIYSSNLGLLMWLGILIGLTFENAIMGLFGIIFILVIGSKIKS